MNVNLYTKIISKIKELQRERNWSTNHFAEEIGISAATLTNWYKRKVIPSIIAIDKICEYFKITISEFFNESTNPFGLTDQQKELLFEWGLLHGAEKDAFLNLIKMQNEIRQRSNPL